MTTRSTGGVITGWITALLGLWEFLDIAAFFTPGFGSVPAFLISHIGAGLILTGAGIWAARAQAAATARKLHWISASAGAWLVVSAFLFGDSASPAGIWNDAIVGGIALTLNIWSAFTVQFG